MSGALRSRLLHKVARPAPPGASPFPGGSEGPPDGWEVVDPSLSDRVVITLDSLLFSAVVRSAQAISRRDFLKRVGQVGVLAGLSMSNLLWSNRPARADGLACRDADGFPCGPSPVCPDRFCRADGQCKLAEAGVKRRGPWESFNCASDTANNCWTEECCGPDDPVPNPGHFRCCDCCVPTPENPRCDNCSKHRCLCKNRTSGCQH